MDDYKQDGNLKSIFICDEKYLVLTDNNPEISDIFFNNAVYNITLILIYLFNLQISLK